MHNGLGARRQTLATVNVAANRKASMAPSKSRGQSIGGPASRAVSLGGRNSVAGRPSTAPGGHAGFRDPRKVGEKEYKQECVQKVIKCLIEKGYQHPISKKMMSETTNREFTNIVSFMMQQLDPNFELQSLDALPEMWRWLGYPGTIRNDAMKVVGGPAWSQLLAVLDWLADLINYKNAAFGADSADQFDDPAEKPGPAGQSQGFLNYSSEKYELYMQNYEDDSPKSQEIDERLRLIFDNKNATAQQHVQGLRDANEQMAMKLSELDSASAALKAQRAQFRELEADEAKFSTHARTLTEYQGKIATKLQEKQEVYNEMQRDMAELKTEKQELTKLVSEQAISPTEAAQMNAELDRHKQALAQHEEQRGNLQSQLSSLEAETSQVAESVDAKVQQCKANESRMQVSSTDAKSGAVLCQQLHMLKQPRADHPGRLLSVDTGAELVPDLQLRHEAVSQDSSVAQDKLVQAQEELRQLEMRTEKAQEDLKGKVDELERLAADEKRQRDQYQRDTREQQERRDGLHDKLIHVRDNSGNYKSEEEVANLQRQYNDFVAASSKKRKRMFSIVHKNLFILTEHKEHIERNLIDLSDFCRDKLTQFEYQKQEVESELKEVERFCRDRLRQMPLN